MSQVLEKPAGSIIEERQESSGLFLFWQQPNNRLIRWAPALFLLFWIGGWAVGWVVVFMQLIDGGWVGIEFFFVLFWLGGWTIGGLYALWMFRVLLRPSRPECLTLGFDSFHHDPGWSFNPFTGWHSYSDYAAYWKEIFKGRNSVELPKSDLNAFILDRVGERQRLAFDFGAERIVIGKVLREPEREWLFRVLEAWRTG